MTKTIKKDNGYGTTYEFEIVESVPKGFIIWNVNILNDTGYLPLCETIAKGSYTVNTNTLKAIKCNGVDKVLKASLWGYNTIKKMDRYLAKNKKTRDTKIINEAYPYMKELKWEN